MEDRLDLHERFWSKVAIGNDDECWEWRAGKDGHGYGAFKLAGRQVLATHVALDLAGRSVPPQMCALHHCDNPGCVNPAHLFIGTKPENNHDMARKGRAAKGARNAARMYPERQVRGERVASSKLTADDVYDIKRRVLAGETRVVVAKEFRVCYRTVCSICAGTTWVHLQGPA